MPLYDQNPQVVLVDNDTNLTPLATTSGSAVSGSAPGLLFFGVTAAGTASFLSLDNSGNLRVTGSFTSTSVLSGAVGQGASGSVPWKVEFYSGSAQVGVQNSPLWITGSVTINTGSASSGGTVNQGTSGSSPWKVEFYSGSAQVGTTNNPIYVTNTTATSTEEATFSVIAQGVAPGNNKSMISVAVASGSAAKVRIKSISIRNVQNAAVTGIVGIFEIRNFISHSAGTSLTPIAHDSEDTLTGSVTVRTGATITGEAATGLDRWFITTDEWGVGTQDVESMEHTFANYMTVYRFSADELCKPITVRDNQGAHVRFSVNSNVGSFDLQIVFSVV